MLEEECLLPQGGDKRLLQKLHDLHDKATNYTKPRLHSDSQFGVSHYAGEVTYDIHTTFAKYILRLVCMFISFPPPSLLAFLVPFVLLRNVDIDGFVSQNRDDIHVDIVQLLLTSAKADVIKLGQNIEHTIFMLLFHRISIFFCNIS
jgi:myosin heavy subunit